MTMKMTRIPAKIGQGMQMNVVRSASATPLPETLVCEAFRDIDNVEQMSPISLTDVEIAGNVNMTKQVE